MNIAEKLKSTAEDKMIEHAIQFAEEIEQKLKDAAKNGYRGLKTKLRERDDAHILKNEVFLENLRLLLEGCEINIRKEGYTNLIFKNKYYEYSLEINW